MGFVLGLFGAAFSFGFAIVGFISRIIVIDCAVVVGRTIGFGLSTVFLVLSSLLSMGVV